MGQEASRDSFVVQDLDVDTLKLMLDYLYLGKIRDTVEELGAEQVQLLMNAADFYVVPGLKRLCEQWLVETLNTTNMVNRLILGDTYSAVNLRQTAKEMLLANSKKLDQIPDWRKKRTRKRRLRLWKKRRKMRRKMKKKRMRRKMRRSPPLRRFLKRKRMKRNMRNMIMKKRRMRRKMRKRTKKKRRRRT